MVIVTYFFRGYPLYPHRLLFLIGSKGSFICTFTQTAHITAFDGPVVDHWLEWKIAQTANASTILDRFAIQEDPNLYSRMLYCLSYVPPLSYVHVEVLKGILIILLLMFIAILYIASYAMVAPPSVLVITTGRAHPFYNIYVDVKICVHTCIDLYVYRVKAL